MKSKLLKVLITTLCVLGILFVIVAVPFILGVMEVWAFKINIENNYLFVWAIGFMACLVSVLLAMLFSEIYDNIDV